MISERSLRKVMKTKDGKIVLRGEIMLAISVVMNALGVLLMLHSGSGISAISSVPYAMNLVLPQLTMGKGIALAGELYDKRFTFVSFMPQPRHAH